MKLVLKKLSAIIVATSLIIGMCTVPAFAQDSEFSAECTITDRVLSISGEGNSRYINAIIMPADNEVDGITVEKLNGSKYISFSMKNTGGFDKSFTLPTGFTDGEYKAVLWDGTENLEIYFILGNDDFKNNLLNSKIDNGELDSVIEKYGHQYGIDSEHYEGLKPSVKSAISEKLEDITITDFANQYKEIVLEEEFKRIETAEEVYDVLVLLETDFTYYNRLDENSKQEVLLKLLKNLPDEMENLKSLAEKYSRDAYEADPDTEGTGTRPIGPEPGNSVVIGPGAKPDTPSSLPSSKTLADISEHWAKDSITRLFKLGIVLGSSDGNFYPDNNITRAEFARMIAGVTGIAPDFAAGTKFSDVEKGSWYFGYVMSVYEHGIMMGCAEDMFGPDNNITRQEMAAAIYRLLDTKGIEMNDEADFADIDTADEYARTAISRLGGAEIILGSEGRFRPADNLTRAEASTVMLKIYNTLNETTKDNLEENQTSRPTTQLTRKEARTVEAEQLIPKLLERPQRGVTRAGFISDVFDLANNVEVKANVQYFKDLPLSREEAASVQGAVDAGLIAKGEEFHPDDVISGYDAICVMVCALGYKEYADLAGYMKVADSLKLLNNISGFSMTDPLDEETAKIMLLNMLQSRMAVKNAYSSDGKFELAIGEETMLENVYGIYVSTGIVKETNLNSLERTGIYKQNKVIIGNMNYTAYADDDYISYLGYQVNAYHTEDNDLVMVAKTYKNKTVSFPLDGANMSENLMIRYTGDDDEKSYKYKLSENYSFLYNSALSEKAPKQVINGSDDGTVEAIDNNDDGYYDVVTVKKPEYVVVDNVSKLNRQIYDKNSSENMIDVFDEDVIFHFEGRSGDIRLLDISRDEIYEVYASEDNQLIEMKLMSTILAGRASSRGADVITINGTKYKPTEYFNEYYADKFELGKDYSFTVSSGGKLICFAKSGSNMQPGYIVNAYTDTDDAEMSIKIFTQNNKFETYNLKKERIRVDGRLTDTTDVYSMIKPEGTINDQFVYYSLDEDGNLTAIDFPQISDGRDIGEEKKENDSLTEYRFNVSTFLYRSTGALMYPKFNVSESMVFVVPYDINDKDVFRVTNNSFFADNTSYSNIKAYNLSQNGSAEVVVVRSDNAVPRLSSNKGSMVVEKVNYTLNEYDEVMKEVTGWVDTKYVSYYIDESISTVKASGEELGFGDIIRFQADGDVIKIMVCDFDANENVFARNDVSDASEMNGGYKNFMYQFGEVYYIGDGYVYIGGGEDGTDVSPSQLRNFATNTTNIAIIDMNEKTVRTGKDSDIKSCQNSGRGDFVVIRQRNLLTMAIYVYVR